MVNNYWTHEGVCLLKVQKSSPNSIYKDIIINDKNNRGPLKGYDLYTYPPPYNKTVPPSINLLCFSLSIHKTRLTQTEEGNEDDNNVPQHKIKHPLPQMEVASAWLVRLRWCRFPWWRRPFPNVTGSKTLSLSASWGLITHSVGGTLYRSRS